MPRALTPEERDLLLYMLGQSLPLHSQFPLVEEMNDCRMGSLRFVGNANRRLGKSICEAEFEDADGVTVSVVLNVDQHGELFELDIWKVDFSPLQRIAAIDQLRLPAPHRRK